jgi:hypothetical protein
MPFAAALGGRVSCVQDPLNQWLSPFVRFAPSPVHGQRPRPSCRPQAAHRACRRTSSARFALPIHTISQHTAKTAIQELAVPNMIVTVLLLRTRRDG